MAPDDYDELLRMVRPAITRSDTKYRKAISANERLALTLRFLATGDNVFSHFYGPRGIVLDVVPVLVYFQQL